MSSLKKRRENQAQKNREELRGTIQLGLLIILLVIIAKIGGHL